MRSAPYAVRAVLALLLALAVRAPPAHAQYAPAYRPPPPPEPRFAITAMTGYQVNSNVDIYGTYGSGQLRIDDGESFGAAITAAVRPGSKVELLWTYLPTQAQVAWYGGGSSSSKPFDMSLNYFQIGGQQTVSRGKVQPFFGATVGAAWYSAHAIETTAGSVVLQPTDTWRFAFGLGLGADVFLSKNVALRLEARTLMPVYFSSGAFYSGPGGTAVAVNGGVPFIQGNFSAGLTFAP
jgi:opacity protein-like surface antigen